MVNLRNAVWICLAFNLLLLLCVFVEVGSDKNDFDEQRPIVDVRPVRIPNQHRQQFEQIEQKDQYDQLCSDYEPAKANGKRCKFNKHCQSGCCVTDDVTRQRSCAPLSKRNERCTIGQLKGGLYDRFCPCETGDAVCKHIPGTNRAERSCAA